MALMSMWYGCRAVTTQLPSFHGRQSTRGRLRRFFVSICRCQKPNRRGGLVSLEALPDGRASDTMVLISVPDDEEPQSRSCRIRRVEETLRRCRCEDSARTRSAVEIEVHRCQRAGPLSRGLTFFPDLPAERGNPQTS